MLLQDDNSVLFFFITQLTSSSFFSPCASNTFLIHTIAKSLLKFKCVSKHCLALITSHAFYSSQVIPQLCRCLFGPGLRYTRVSSSSESWWVLQLWFCTSQYFFKKNISFLKTRIIQSCNGLFLCCDVSTRFFNIYSSRFCVRNPTSKKYAWLPPLLSLPSFLFIARCSSYGR